MNRCPACGGNGIRCCEFGAEPKVETIDPRMAVALAFYQDIHPALVEMMLDEYRPDSDRRRN